MSSFPPGLHESLSAIRHQLRGPLAALVAAVEVLETATEGSEEAAEARRIVGRQARHLSGLISELTSPPPPPAPSRAQPKPLRVLVITGDRDRYRALLQTFPAAYEVHAASGGMAGLERLLELQPDVSIVELGLPGLSGQELALQARSAGYPGRMIALCRGPEVEMGPLRASGFDDALTSTTDAQALLEALQPDSAR